MKKIIVIASLLFVTDLCAMGFPGENDPAAESNLEKLSRGQRKRDRKKRKEARASDSASLASSAPTPSDAGSVSSSRLSHAERGGEGSPSWLKGTLQGWSRLWRGDDVDDATCLDALWACGQCCSSATRCCGTFTMGVLVTIMGSIALLRSTPNITFAPNFDFSNLTFAVNNAEGMGLNFSMPVELEGPWIQWVNTSFPGVNVSWTQDMTFQTPGGGGGGLPFPRPGAQASVHPADAAEFWSGVANGSVNLRDVPPQLVDLMLRSHGNLLAIEALQAALREPKKNE